MRIEKTQAPIFSLQTQLNQNGWNPKTWGSSLTSLCFFSHLFYRLKLYLTAPFTYLRAFLFPKTFTFFLPTFTRTGKKSSNETMLKKELEEKGSPVVESSFLMVGNFSLDEQVLLLDQFDKIVSYTKEIAANNWGKVEVSLGYNDGIEYNFGPCTAEKLSEYRNELIEKITTCRRQDIQFVLEVKYYFSSWFGERFERIKQTVLATTRDGIQFI